MRILILLLLIAASAEARDACKNRPGRQRCSQALLKILSPPGAGYDSTNVSLTTGSGAAVTCARASAMSIERTQGALTSIASNKCGVDYSGALVVEPPGTNLLLQSDWAGATSGSPGTAPTSWSRGFGTGTSTTLATSTLGASAQAIQFDADSGERIYFEQTVTVTSGATYAVSIYVEAVSGACGHTVTVLGGTVTDSTQTNNPATTGRKTLLTTTTGTSLTVRVGAGTTTTLSGTCSIIISRPQLETGSVATSYIPTTTAAASRAAQTTTVSTPADLSETEGCAKVCVTPQWTGLIPTSNGTFFSGNAASTALFGYTVVDAQVFRAFDGTRAAEVAVTWTAGARKCFRTSWSASRSALTVTGLTDGTSTSTAGFTGFPSFGATIEVGSRGGTEQARARLDSIVFGSSFDGCR